MAKLNNADKQLLKESWLKFVNKEQLSDRSIIRPEILQSWQRCSNIDVDPWQKVPARVLEPQVFADVLKRRASFIELCVPFMESLNEFVKGSGFVIALADKDGVLLKVIGDKNIADSVKKGGFSEGWDWSEKSAGTNAVGTALATCKPIQVYSFEHYCRHAQISTGSFDVIRQPSGKVIGAIGLVGYDYAVHSHTLGMAVAVAKAVNNQLVILSAQKKLQKDAYYKETIINTMSQAMLAVDENSCITHINRKALRILSLPENSEYNGKSLPSVLGSENEALQKVIESHASCTDKEISITTPGGSSRYNITARVIQEKGKQASSSGMVIVLDSIGRVRRLAHKMSGAVASITFDDLVGHNPLYLNTVQHAKNAAKTSSNILLLGESGTGKDVFAQAIHNHSERSCGPFVSINCSAIPRDLIGSELFGYADGAFTGARKEGNPGKFELADGGTIFLDEIGDMPLELQGHLLRVIEEKKLTRIGGNDVIRTNVRIIAATNRDLKQDIDSGHFRHDLYYRLNVLQIHMLPLRERMDDLEELIMHFYRKQASNLSLPIKPVPEDVIEHISRLPLTGNIRELQNIIERCLIMSQNGALEVASLPADVLSAATASPAYGKNMTVGSERRYILGLLQKNRGNISKTAQELGVARTTLYRKMDRLGISTRSPFANEQN